MEKFTEEIERGVRERVVSLIEKHKVQENRKLKELAEYCGRAQSAIGKWRDGIAAPDTASIVAIAKYFGVSPLWILTGEEEKKVVPLQNGDRNGKVYGEIKDKSLFEIDLWIKEMNDGLDYGPMIKGLVAKEYLEFREWLKKTSQAIVCHQG